MVSEWPAASHVLGLMGVFTLCFRLVILCSPQIEAVSAITGFAAEDAEFPPYMIYGPPG